MDALDALMKLIESNQSAVMQEFRDVKEDIKQTKEDIREINDNCKNQCAGNGDVKSNKVDFKTISLIVSLWEVLPLWMRIIFTGCGAIGSIGGILMGCWFCFRWVFTK